MFLLFQKALFGFPFFASQFIQTMGRAKWRIEGRIENIFKIFFKKP